MTDQTEENIRAAARIVKEALGRDVGVYLLPCHRLGESTNEGLGRIMDLSVSVPSDKRMQELKGIV